MATEGECSTGASIGPDLQLDHARVAELLGERDVLPAEARLAHVDRDQPVGMLLAR